MKRTLLWVLAALLLSVAPLSAAENPVVVMSTNYGDVKIELFAEKAPVTVKNFLDYVDDKHYDGTVFHRVIPTFMIQGGGFDTNKKKKDTKAAIKNESANGLSNKRGTLAMARTSEPNSATNQFFINVVDNDFLDRAKARDGVGYCVFGRVVGGMDVVDKIKAVKTERGPGAFANAPAKDVIIKSITREKK